jgi:hypothetical protein
MLEDEDPEAAQPLLNEMRALADRKRALLSEKDAIAHTHQDWEAAQSKLQELEEWCEDIASKIEQLTWEEKWVPLEALGINVKVWRTEHDPRVYIGTDLKFIDEMVKSTTTS